MRIFFDRVLSLSDLSITSESQGIFDHALAFAEDAAVELLVFADLADYFVFGFIDRHVYIFGLSGRAHALAGCDEIDLGKPDLAMLHIADAFADFELATRMIGVLIERFFDHLHATVDVSRYFYGCLIIGGFDAYIHISIYTTPAVLLFPLPAVEIDQACTRNDSANTATIMMKTRIIAMTETPRMASVYPLARRVCSFDRHHYCGMVSRVRMGRDMKGKHYDYNHVC